MSPSEVYRLHGHYVHMHPKCGLPQKNHAGNLSEYNTKFSRAKIFVIFVKGHMITKTFSLPCYGCNVDYYHEIEEAARAFSCNFDPWKLGAIRSILYPCYFAPEIRTLA